jgi:hypothetical protein
MGRVGDGNPIHPEGRRRATVGGNAFRLAQLYADRIVEGEMPGDPSGH